MRYRLSVFIVSLVLLFVAVCALAEQNEGLKLPPPECKGGMPLMDALMARRSIREYSTEPLPLQIISDLLWAGFGINHPEKGLRTAPSARNMQEIDVYLAMKDGLYLYDAKDNSLVLVSSKDIREATGVQPFVKDAPLNLVFVADYSKMGNMSEETKAIYAAADAAFISENIYLYCASAGLATVVRGAVNKDALAAAMGLPESRKVVFAQTVGYPRKQE